MIYPIPGKTIKYPNMPHQRILSRDIIHAGYEKKSGGARYTLELHATALRAIIIAVSAREGGGKV